MPLLLSLLCTTVTTHIYIYIHVIIIEWSWYPILFHLEGKLFIFCCWIARTSRDMGAPTMDVVRHTRRDGRYNYVTSTCIQLAGVIEEKLKAKHR
jgi:hypothetical protein